MKEIITMIVPVADSAKAVSSHEEVASPNYHIPRMERQNGPNED
jgi:hypothetical protein